MHPWVVLRAHPVLLVGDWHAMVSIHAVASTCVIPSTGRWAGYSREAVVVLYVLVVLRALGAASVLLVESGCIIQRVD